MSIDTTSTTRTDWYIMSNLNLGNVSFSGLVSRILSARSDTPTIAYATTARYVQLDDGSDSFVVIYHHGHRIAEIAADWVYVTNAGYGSMTTRARLNAILRGNDVPLYIAQRNYAQCLFQRIPVLVDGIGEHIQITDDFTSITWDHVTQAIRSN